MRIGQKSDCNGRICNGFGQVDIDREGYFENVLRILRYVVQDELKRLNETVDRQEWTTTPAVVNAYYSRTRNQISYFPIAIQLLMILIYFIYLDFVFFYFFIRLNLIVFIL